MADPISPAGNLGRGVSGPLVELQAVEASRNLLVSAQNPPKPPPLSKEPADKPGKDRRGGEGPVPSLEDQEKALNSLREDLKLTPSELSIREDKESGRIVFKVINPKTGEILRQVPSEEILAMARKLRQISESGAQPAGVLVDQNG